MLMDGAAVNMRTAGYSGKYR